MSLKLKEEYSDDEIYDYINTIYEYNIKYETNRLQEQLKKEIDPIKKAQLAQKIIDLRIMKEKETER